MAYKATNQEDVETHVYKAPDGKQIKVFLYIYDFITWLKIGSTMHQLTKGRWIIYDADGELYLVLDDLKTLSEAGYRRLY